MNVRVHNDFVTQARIAGQDVDYIDTEIEDTLDWVREQQEQNANKEINDMMVKETEALQNG